MPPMQSEATLRLLHQGLILLHQMHEVEVLRQQCREPSYTSTNVQRVGLAWSQRCWKLRFTNVKLHSHIRK